MQWCIKFIIPPYQLNLGRISSCEEGNIMTVWKNITWNKGKWEKISFPFNIEAIGKNIKWGKGEKDGNFGEENPDIKNEGGEEYRVEGNFIQPC